MLPWDVEKEMSTHRTKEMVSFGVFSPLKRLELVFDPQLSGPVSPRREMNRPTTVVSSHGLREINMRH